MKRLFPLFLACLLLTCTACAEGFRYSTQSVTDSANTNALYDVFYASGELAESIPGCAEDVVPQGVGYLPQEDWLLFSGYSSGGDRSSIIAVDHATDAIVKEIYLSNVDGTPYTGHAGGVCATENNIYVANAGTLYRISLDAYRALPAASECSFEEAIPVPVTASYCNYSDGILWVGEFQYGGEYKTDASHKVKSDDGRYKAWCCGYVLDPVAEKELDVSAPDYILSTTERIQGMTVKNGEIYLSQSYGRRNLSMIYRYSNVLPNEPDATAELNGQTVPIWCLDSGVQLGAIVAPPMTEGLCTVGDAVCVLFESVAAKYIDPEKPSANPIDQVFMLTAF